MKLFKQLLVAPAALGLLAPMAAGATEVNVAGVSDYAPVSADAVAVDQVTSITQFSDVYPTDWAYQALSNLIERYGCVAGYPNGTYRGNRAMTRFEAAALLNACLDRVTEVTDELKRLMKEFEKELAIVKGRVDGLEARVGELEATQFSTTTKLKGQTTFVIGANSYGGSAEIGDTKVADLAAAASGATTFNYDMRLFLDTSFTGKDLLRTMLRGGNFNSSAFGGNSAYSGLSTMETAYEEGGADQVNVNRIWYQFPIGSSFTATVGGRVRQDDMLAVWPSAYPADTVLDFFTYAGAPQTYNLQLGAGAGLWWSDNDFSISVNYVSGNGKNGNPTVVDRDNAFARLAADQDCGGIGSDCSSSSGTIQIAYAPDNWGVAAAYNYASGDNGAGIYAGNGTPLANLFSGLGTTNSVGLSAWWTPENAGWFPSISTGWGYNSVDIKNANLGPADLGSGSIEGATSQSWYVGLQWADVFLKGNAAGMAVGQPTFVTSWDNNSSINDGSDFVADGNYAWEWWYMFQVTDNISVTPAIFYLSRPLGYNTSGLAATDDDATFNNFGGLVKTTFRF